MKQNKNIFIIIGLLIILVVGGYFLLKDTFTEWNLNLDKTKKNAYGTFLFYELLKEKNKKTGFIEIDDNVTESLRKLDKKKTYTYFFVNYTPYYDKATLDTLYDFANAGNTVFIACEHLSGRLRDSILKQEYQLTTISGINKIYYQNIDSNIEWKNHSVFNFIHPSLKDTTGYSYFLLNQADTVTNYFYQFIPIADSSIVHPMKATDQIIFAGYENSYDIGLNLAILKHGKGNIILLLSAVPFTNYFMRSKKGLEYVEKLFSIIPNQPAIWDDVSHKYKFTNDDLKDQGKGDSSFGESPLYFILKHISLRWAWYLLIFGVLIYAFFHAKRRQNIIPLIEPKENNSLKYVESIGQLYFHEAEHFEIANEMRLLFLNFIRQKYFIKTNELDDNFVKLLVLKSTIEEEKIRDILVDFKDIEKIHSIDQNRLHNLNNKLEYFYTHCK